MNPEIELLPVLIRLPTWHEIMVPGCQPVLSASGTVTGGFGEPSRIDNYLLRPTTGGNEIEVDVLGLVK
jgi:hypothetical protein